MALIIQGPNLSNDDIIYIKSLSAKEVHRFEGILSDSLELVKSFCDSRSLDYGFVPQDRKLSHFKLVVSDMDSTLITIECIDEIADMQGLKPQVAAITASAMRGELDFSESLKRRVALLEGLDEDALSRVYTERLNLTPGAEKLIERIKSHGLKFLLVSGGFTFFTERLKGQLGLDFTAANTLEIKNGKLTGKLLGQIVDAEGKLQAMRKVMAELQVRPVEVLGLGDGANDLKFLLECGVSVAYHAKPVVRAQTTHALNHVGIDGVLNLFN